MHMYIYIACRKRQSDKWRGSFSYTRTYTQFSECGKKVACVFLSGVLFMGKGAFLPKDF